MQVEKDPNFNNNLVEILKFIAVDSPKNAKKFKKELDKMILSLPHMPYKYRKSYYYDDENIRDLVFMGYTVPYLVDQESSKIVILDLFKWIDR